MSLIDPKILVPADPGLAVIAELATGRKGSTPERFAKGVYLSQHWNFEWYLSPEPTYEQRYTEVKAPPPYYSFHAFGVCDSPEQFMRTVGRALELDKRSFVASLVRISADEQPKEGGWRWYKWGPYVGDGKPTCEYIHDERFLRVVYTFHFYEVKP